MMLPSFRLESYFAEWEFKAPYLLCCSDMESMTKKELLALADPESLHLWENLSLGYTETKGLPLLREQISLNYASVDAGHILTCAGAEEALYAAMHALIQPMDHVVLFTPCYQSLEAIPESLHAAVSKIPLIPMQDGWGFDFKLYEKALEVPTRLVILNFPHNPTGALISRETLAAIVGLARKKGAYILSDEVYRLLEIDEKKRLPALADFYEKGISISVMTKAYGLGGLRIGWIASRDNDFLDRAANIKHYLSIANSSASEILSLIALRAQDSILQKNRKILLENLAHAENFFNQYSALFTWNRPAGGCIAFPSLKEDRDSDLFAKKLVEEKGVLLLPSSIFDWEPSYFRIGFGRKNMKTALALLEQFILENNYV